MGLKEKAEAYSRFLTDFREGKLGKVFLDGKNVDWSKFKVNNLVKFKFFFSECKSEMSKSFRLVNLAYALHWLAAAARLPAATISESFFSS